MAAVTMKQQTSGICGILREMTRERSKLPVLDFRKTDFGLFRDLLGRLPWVKALEEREAQESQLVLKDHFLQSQE